MLGNLEKSVLNQENEETFIGRNVRSQRTVGSIEQSKRFIENIKMRRSIKNTEK